MLSDEEKKYHYDNYGTAEGPEIDFDDVINSGLFEMMNNLFKPKKGSKKKTRMGGFKQNHSFNKLFKDFENMFDEFGNSIDEDEEDMYENGQFGDDYFNMIFAGGKPGKKKPKNGSDDEWEDVDEEWEDLEES